MWYIDDAVPGSEIGYRAIVDDEGCTICEPSPMGEENARLIAAAPMLLFALEECVDLLEQMKDAFDDPEGVIEETLINAALALRKAYLRRRH